MRNKSAILLAAITLAAFASCADPLAGDLGLYCPEDHFLFRTIDNGTAVEITGYVGGRIDVHIPPYIRGLPVTVIGDWGFQGEGYRIICDESNEQVGWTWVKYITSITIPDSIIHIAIGAFNLNQLTSVTIPNGINYIGGWAFRNNQLAYIVIPNSDAYVSEDAFDIGTIVTMGTD